MKTFLLGPFAQNTRIAVLIRILIVIVLTVLTQVGGIFIWPTLGLSNDDIGWKYRLRRWLYPIGAYLLGNLFLLPLAAPLWSMEALPCNGSSFLQPRSSLTCLMNRHYLKKDAKKSILRVSFLSIWYICDNEEIWNGNSLSINVQFPLYFFLYIYLA